MVHTAERSPGQSVKYHKGSRNAGDVEARRKRHGVVRDTKYASSMNSKHDMSDANGLAFTKGLSDTDMKDTTDEMRLIPNHRE